MTSPAYDVEAQPELIAELEEIARAEGLSGRELGRRCNIAHPHWSRVRRGQFHLGAVACARIVAAYPRLRGAAARYLAEHHGPDTLRLLAEAGGLLPPPDRPPEGVDPPG